VSPGNVVYDWWVQPRLPLGAGIVLGAAVVLAAVPAGAQVEVPTGGVHVLERVPPPDAPLRGPRLAEVTIEEFACFPCPPSAEIQPALREALERHGERVRLLFRHLPQAQHAHSQAAAEAACEAGAQGRFWPYHDALFARGGRIGHEDLFRAAVQAGLDVDRLRHALADGRHRDEVRSDERLARARGIRVAPTLVVNGEVLVGPRGALDLDRAIAAGLSRARELRSRGVTLVDLFGVMVGGQVGRPRRVHVPLGSSPRKGPRHARVTIVLFADLAEAQAAVALAKLVGLQEDHRADVRIAFRNAAGAHPISDTVACTAAEAEVQGRFWELVPHLRTSPRDVSAVERAAQQAGIDLAALREAAADGRHRTSVEADRRLAKKLSVGRTALFVNGRAASPTADADELRTLIEEERRGGFLGRLRRKDGGR